MNGPTMVAECQRLKDVYQAPYYESADYYSFLNRSVSAIVNNYFPENNAARTFEDNQRATDDLQTLITTANPAIVSTGLTVIHPRITAYITLPDTYRFFWGVNIKFGSTFAKKITVITFDEIDGIFDDPFATPDTTNNVFICWHNGKIMIISGSVPSEFYLYFIRQPAEISASVDCDLPIHMHMMVTTLAFQIGCLPIDELNKFQVSQLLNRINKNDNAQ
jgi:hypothetical protein